MRQSNLARVIAFVIYAIFFHIVQHCPATTVLFTDNFTLTSPNPNAQDLNYQISTRQTGTLAPISYSNGQEPIFSQVGNGGAPNALLLAGRSLGTSGGASPDFNFNESPGIGNALVIQFDVNPVQVASGFNTTSSSWMSINFGAGAGGRNVFPQFTDGIGLLFRGNRQTQAFNNGTNLGTSQFALTADTNYHHIRIQISNTVTGNPFTGDGSPDLIQAFSDSSSTPFFSYIRPTGFSSDYLAFVGEGEGSGGDGVVRHVMTNLEVSIESVPEPTSFALLGIGMFGLAARRRFTHGHPMG